MSTLLVIAYPDEETAATVSDEVLKLQDELLISLEDMAVIRRDPDGKFHTTTGGAETAAGALGGAFWGLLFGLLLFVPIGGLIVGGLFGALMGKLTNTEIKGDFQRRVRDKLQPGSSALFLIIRQITPDKVAERLSHYGGEVLQTNLSEADEKELRESLHGPIATDS